MSVVLATGYSAQIAFNEETTYGVAATNTTYNWFGIVSNLTATLDQKPIVLYRMDGSSRYPPYILQGPREVSVDLTFVPQNEGILNDLILNAPTVSHTIIINYTGINQSFTITGARANTLTLGGKAGDVTTCKVSYWAQSMSSTIPTGVTFPSDPGNTPWFFNTEEVAIGGSSAARVLDYSIQIANNLERVYQFGLPYIRALPPKLGAATGNMTVTFENLTDFNDVFSAGAIGSLTAVTVSIFLDMTQSPPKCLCMPNAVFHAVPVPSVITDLIKMNLSFTARSTQVAGSQAVLFS